MENKEMMQSVEIEDEELAEVAGGATYCVCRKCGWTYGMSYFQKNGCCPKCSAVEYDTIQRGSINIFA